MNILIVTPFDCDAIGGVSSTVLMLAKVFTASGHVVDILAPSPSNWMIDIPSDSGAVHGLYLRLPRTRTRRLRGLFTFCLMLPVTMLQLARLCKRKKIDAVIIQYPQPQFFYFGFLRRVSPWKLIASFQGSDAHRLNELSGLNRLCMAILLKAADHISAVASSLLAKVKVEYPAMKLPMCLIPNGATALPTPSASVNADIELPERFLFSAGHLIHRKGYDVLIKTMALVEKQGSVIDLVIAGDGEERQSLQQLVEKHNLSGKIHFVGWRNHEQMLDMMHRCLFFVLTSRAEGLPLVIVEAMMSGKTVLATGVDGVPDIVQDGNNGIVVDSEDAQSTADAIQRLVANDDFREQLERTALRSVQHRFSWSAIAEQYLELAK